MTSSRQWEEIALLRQRMSAAENSLGSLGSRVTALEGGTPNTNNPTVVNYTQDLTGEFNNPGRGMEESFESDAGIGGGSGTLDDEGIASYANSTFRRYWWCPTADAALPGSFLTGVEQDIDNAVAAGKLMNGKFAYVGGGEPQLSKSRIDGHINQLLPVISGRAYAFRQLEMGWFGPWGEFHGITSSGWTDNSPSNGPQPQTLAMFQNIANNTPSDLFIGVRYPEVAMWMESNGLSEAHKARLGIYNDDFLSSNGGPDVAIEGGTFPGAWTDGVDVVRREWLHNVGLSRPVRGESGVDNIPSGDGDFALLGDNAMYYGFQRQHIDNLREWGLISIVLDPKGVTARAKREMGYRLRIKQGRFPQTVADNTSYVFDLEIENLGVAPPRRNYVAKVKFGTSANTSAAAWVTATMNAVAVDANNVPTTTGAALTTRQWLGWQSTSQPTTTRWVRFTCTVPTGLLGNYPISLALIDPNTQLQSHVGYNIRLANVGTWDATNGRNNLLFQVNVT